MTPLAKLLAPMTPGEILADIRSTNSAIHYADGENVAAQYAARCTQQRLDDLKERLRVLREMQDKFLP